MILAMDGELFARLHQSLKLRNGRILLVGLDGIIRARVPDTQAVLGSQLPDRLLAPFRAGVTEISELRDSAVDGTAGFTTWRRVAGYPLLVSVRLEAEQVLAEPRLRRQQWLISGLLLTLLIALLCLAVIRSRQAKAHIRVALEGTFANVRHGIMMVDAAGRVMLSNTRVDALLGLPPGLAVPGRPLAEIVAWQERMGEYGGEVPKLHHDSEVPRHPGQPFIWERTRPNGSVLEVRVDHLPDGSYVRTWTDVTEARQAAKAIAAARDAADAARAALIVSFEHAPLGILLVDTERRVQFMNRSARALLDLPHDLARPGTPVHNILQSHLVCDDLEVMPSSCLSPLTDLGEGQSVDRKLVYECPTADGRMVEVRRRGLLDGRIILTFADISARHAALLEEREARAAAEAALRSRSEFLGIVSHELLTPLNALIGLSQVLLMQPLGVAQRSNVMLIEEAGRELLALMNDVLDVARS
jgi:PAS domain-containing protein